MVADAEHVEDEEAGAQAVARVGANTQRGLVGAPFIASGSCCCWPDRRRGRASSSWPGLANPAPTRPGRAVVALVCAARESTLPGQRGWPIPVVAPSPRPGLPTLGAVGSTYTPSSIRTGCDAGRERDAPGADRCQRHDLDLRRAAFATHESIATRRPGEAALALNWHGPCDARSRGNAREHAETRENSGLRLQQHIANDRRMRRDLASLGPRRDRPNSPRLRRGRCLTRALEDARGQAARMRADEPPGRSPWQLTSRRPGRVRPRVRTMHYEKTLAGIGADSRSKSM